MPAFIGFARDESGVAAIEYAGGLIALVMIAAMTWLARLFPPDSQLAGSFT